MSLTLEQGEVFGFLGPNGAGKTTTVKVLEHGAVEHKILHACQIVVHLCVLRHNPGNSVHLLRTPAGILPE